MHGRVKYISACSLCPDAKIWLLLINILQTPVVYDSGGKVNVIHRITARTVTWLANMVYITRTRTNWSGYLTQLS